MQKQKHILMNVIENMNLNHYIYIHIDYIIIWEI